jgi:23S rRNA pseudouridine2605 synthase
MVDHLQDPIAAADNGQAARDIETDGAPESAAPDIASDGDRVAKVLARAGVASRREVERLIESGRVRLNGAVLTTPAVKVAPGDVLSVDGKPVGAAEATRVWRYHKPAGLVTTHKDPKGRDTVFDHLPPGLPRVISVGRLDLNTEGLLLLTNDGALARALELPATGLVRRYRARARGRVTQERLDGLKDGLTVEGVRYGAIEARLDKAKEGGSGANLWITLALSEGKNREVRKVLEALGLTVNRLIRLSYGPFQLGTLAAGAAEEIGPRVIREQLGQHIAAENMPTGSQVAVAPAAAQSRARGSGVLSQDREKPVYKPGWAKPKKRPARAPRKVKPAGAQTPDKARAASPRKPSAKPAPSGPVRAPAVRSDRSAATSSSPRPPKAAARPPRSSGARRPGPPKGTGPRPRG